MKWLYNLLRLSPDTTVADIQRATNVLHFKAELEVGEYELTDGNMLVVNPDFSLTIKTPQGEEYAAPPGIYQMADGRTATVEIRIMVENLPETEPTEEDAPETEDGGAEGEEASNLSIKKVVAQPKHVAKRQPQTIKPNTRNMPSLNEVYEELVRMRAAVEEKEQALEETRAQMLRQSEQLGNIDKFFGQIAANQKPPRKVSSLDDDSNDLRGGADELTRLLNPNKR